MRILLSNKAVPKELFGIPTLYTWFRDGQCLYVGQTRTPEGRFDSEHLINRVGLAEGDELWWWPMNWYKLRKYETYYIHKFKAKYNLEKRKVALDAYVDYKEKQPVFICSLRDGEWKIGCLDENKIATFATFVKPAN
jgi:hypothetical protein